MKIYTIHVTYGKRMRYMAHDNVAENVIEEYKENYLKDIEKNGLDPKKLDIHVYERYNETAEPDDVRAGTILAYTKESFPYAEEVRVR